MSRSGPEGGVPVLADARRVLIDWAAPDAAQQQLRREHLAFLDEHPVEGASRDLRAGHLTASTLLLDHDRARVLLTLHPLAGQWFQLGGHIEPGDTSLRAAAQREAREESGIDGVELLGDPIGLDRHPTRCRDAAGALGPSSHLDVEYVGITPPGAAHRRSAESLDLAWFDLDALPAGADAVVRSLIARARGLGLA